MWIQRDIEQYIEGNNDPIQIIRGPRQCGKSSLVLHLDSSFIELSLDDTSLRDLAQDDPELFLKQFDGKKIFIDEAQYAPRLFPALKRRVDLFKRELDKTSTTTHTIIRLTGSNQILLDKEVKESLAGRASFFDMNTLSVSEIHHSAKKTIQEILYMGGFPEIHKDTSKNVKKYLDDYINSYIERDIILTAGIQKSREFLKFLRLLAGRVGEILDFSTFAKLVGVDGKTIKDWISVLEKMQIIALAMPFTSNLSKRLIKSPKIFFIDTGLACRLQGWTSSEPILTSPQQGHLFENLVFSEIYKMNLNFGLGWQIFHWRSRDGEEVDFLIQKDLKEYIFVEAKVSSQKLANLSSFPEVKKIFKDSPPLYIQCHQEGEMIINNHVPINMLQNFLLDT